MNDFFKKLQKADNDTKKQWLIILSAVSMIAVVIVWIFYMNDVVLQNPDETATQEVKVNFWSAVGGGLGVTGKNVISGIKGGVSEIISGVQKLK